MTWIGSVGRLHWPSRYFVLLLRKAGIRCGPDSEMSKPRDEGADTRPSKTVFCPISKPLTAAHFIQAHLKPTAAFLAYKLAGAEVTRVHVIAAYDFETDDYYYRIYVSYVESSHGR